MNNKVALITGTYPPQKCGVGDYSYNMMNASCAKNWSLFYYSDWSIKTLFQKIKDLRHCDAEFINIQYPSIGYGYSLVPHLLCIFFSVFTNKKVSVTLHEFTRLGKKSRFATHIFLIFAHKLIFTNEFERSAAIKSLFFVKNKSQIIKIFSNIKPFSEIHDMNRRTLDIGYFGLLTPLKGLEDFLSVAKQVLQTNPNIQIYIMGQTLSEYKQYSDDIIEKAVSIGVRLYLNEDETFVSKTLSETKICYLPYPDGVSERRGSFLATIVNYCMVLTTKGRFTTKSHETICAFTDLNHAPQKLMNMLKDYSVSFDNHTVAVHHFLKTELPDSWDQIVRQYVSFISES